MKTPASLWFTSAAFALVAAPLAQLNAAPPRATAHLHPVTFAERNSSLSVSRGCSRHEVESSLGSPQSKLTEDVWVYREFGVPIGFGGCRACDRLVVTFVGGVVTDLQLINASAEKIYTARLRATKEQPKVAAR